MSVYKRIKRRVYEIIGPARSGDVLSMLYDIFICTLVVASSAAVVAELVGVPASVERGLILFEYVTVSIFILEYLLHLWVSDLIYPEYENRLRALWEYVTSFDSLIDLLSIFSIFMNAIPKAFAILRLIKLIKLVRLVKISDHVRSSDGVRQKMRRVQIRVNEIIDKAEHGDVLSKIFDIFMTVLILISVSFLFLQTFPLTEGIHEFIRVAEIVMSVFFGIEYVLRVWTAPIDYPEMRPDKARMHYIFSFMSFIDLLAIVPMYITVLPNTAGIFKLLKLCKILRLVKASRYLTGIANFGIAIRKKKKQIIFSFVFIILLIIVCSALLYSFEHEAQPDSFRHGLSGVMYCVMVLVEKEPEIAPVTTMGKALSTVMLLLGGCMLGVPVAFIATGFEDMVREQAGDHEEEQKDAFDVLREWDSLSEEEKAKFALLTASLEQTKSDETATASQEET